MRWFYVFTIICIFKLIFINCAKLKFKMKVISLQDCKLPYNTLDRSKPVSVKYALRRISRDISLIDVEFNVTTKIGPLMTSARTYNIRQNSAKDLISRVVKSPCTSLISKQLNMPLKLKFDRECNALPGSYVIKDLNLSSLSWLMTTMATAPGIYIYELEHSHPKGIIDCTKFTCDLIKVK